MSSQSPELKSVSAELLENGLISLAGNLLELRPAGEADRPFIISSWVRSYQPISRKLRVQHQQTRLSVSDEVYLANHPAVAEELWPLTYVLKDPDESSGAVFAYVCGQHTVLHYCYVVPELRRMGVAKAIIESKCGKLLQFSHVWPHSVPSGWKYNPYLVRKLCL